jgi:hypothetical protein
MKLIDSPLEEPRRYRLPTGIAAEVSRVSEVGWLSPHPRAAGTAVLGSGMRV